MLPSMPIIFTRESQDAFGNKIQPSTSYFNPGPSASNPKLIQTEQRLVKQIENLNKEKAIEKVNEEKNEEPSIINLNTYENGLVSTYYNKIIARFKSTKSNVFAQFKEVLKTFDPLKETPIDLYSKVEHLFGNDNKDLVEEFLIFLTPGQATELGRFSEHLMLRKMNQFLFLLQKSFGHKPTTHKRIMRIFTNSMKACDLKELRTKVLPLLKSKPQLCNMFKMLLPDEEPFDLTCEDNADKVTESFLTDDNGFDEWEFDDRTENRRNLTVKPDLDTMYLQGRVFLQYGKMLKATKVTYPYSKEPYRVHAQRLAPSHCRLSPSPSDEETSPRKKTNKPTKPVTKRAKKTKTLIKDVNGNNKQADAKVLNLHDNVKGNKSKHTHNEKKTVDLADKKELKSNKALDLADKKEIKSNKALELADKKELKSNKALDLADKKDLKSNKALELTDKKESKSSKALVLADKKESKSNNVMDLTDNKDSKNSKTIELADNKESKINKTLDLAGKKELKTNKTQELADKKESKSKAKDKEAYQKNLVDITKANKHKLDTKQHLELPKAKKNKLDSVKIKANEKKTTVNHKEDNKWTRDEDKTMLEILQGEARSDVVFGKIRRLLPHKSMTEIQDRFLYVMNLLQQMAVGEVT